MKYYEALVADDNEVSLFVCQELIGAYNINVTTAQSGAEALARAVEKRFNIVFLDHIMPGLSGAEVCAEIRKIRGYAKTPIIALSGNDASEYEDLYRQVKITAAIPKPLEPGTLDALLKKYLKDVELLPDQLEISQPALPPEPAWYLKLKTVRQIDIAAALALMRGNYDSLRRTLDGFCAQVETKVPFMSDCIVRGAFEEYAVEAHSFKSSLNNIGASGFSHKARELELAADAGDVIGVERNSPALFWVLNALRKIIENTREAEGAKLRGDTAELFDALNAALAAIEDYETDDAVRIMNEQKKLRYSDSIDRKITSLSILLDAYDYSGFISTAKALAAEIGEMI